MVYKLNLILALIFFYLNDTFAHPKRIDDRNDKRIVGGHTIDLSEAPYQAFLRLNNGLWSFMCGGSIISKYYILTAGHCLHRKTLEVLRIGTSKLDAGGQIYQADEFDVHPKYHESVGGAEYDVGYVKTTKEMMIDGKNTKIIKLANANRIVEPGTKLFISGWGSESDLSPDSEVLQGVQVTVISLKECKQIFDKQFNITERHICAGSKKEGTNPCFGDSGGAAVTKDLMVGIVSFGGKCVEPPAVYTNIANPDIRGWIKTKTGI